MIERRVLTQGSRSSLKSDESNMKSILRVIIFVTVFLLLTGCEKDHQINLPPHSILGLSLYVETENGETGIDYHELRRSDPHYQEIEDWLEKNVSGWRTYPATAA